MLLYMDAGGTVLRCLNTSSFQSCIEKNLFFFLQLMSTSLGITVLGVRVYGGGAAGEVARQLAHSTADGVYAIHTAEG